MTDQQKVREAFEAHILKLNPCSRLYRHQGGAYRTVSIERAWQLWQAAIAHASSATVKENLTVGYKPYAWVVDYRDGSRGTLYEEPPLTMFTVLRAEIRPLYLHPASSSEDARVVPNIKTMVDRFLSWRLPQDFRPDGGISFTHITEPAWTHDTWPTGTNLFHAGQVEAMLRHVLDVPDAEDARDAMRWRALCELIDSDGTVYSNLIAVISDAFNLGSGALERHIDQALADERGGK